MSECKIKRDFCLTHKCWVTVWGDPRCPVSELAAEVERLTALLKAADDVVASQDRRIEKALGLLHHPTEVNGCTCLAHQIAVTLRGES